MATMVLILLKVLLRKRKQTILAWIIDWYPIYILVMGHRLISLNILVMDPTLDPSKAQMPKK